MGSDVPHLRYILPRFKGNYTKFMKTLESGCAFDASDIAKYRLKVLEFGHTYGWKAVQDAFGVQRSTYYLWKQKCAQGKLSSLVPISTKPHRVRQMKVDQRILAFIREVREQYGRIGKKKLEVLLAAYCLQLGIPAVKATTIGKIIHRNRYFFEGQRIHRKRRDGVLRVRSAPKEKIPGYIEMDSVIVRVLDRSHTFVTAIDVVTKFALCIYSSTPTARKAKELLERFRSHYVFPIRTLQTDNGSEFLGELDQYCQQEQIPHFFTYPRSPRINGGVERFNRTIQEEFIERTDAVYSSHEEIQLHLQHYLSWYNEKRPHQSLGMKSPSQYIQLLLSNM